MDNSAAKRSSHGEQDGQAGAMDTCGTAHTLDSAPAHITTRATASAMPAHFSHKSQPAEQAPPFDLLPCHKRTRADMDISTNTHCNPHTYHCVHTDGTVTQTPAGIVICVHSLGQHSHIAMASHAHCSAVHQAVSEPAMPAGQVFCAGLDVEEAVCYYALPSPHRLDQLLKCAQVRRAHAAGGEAAVLRTLFACTGGRTTADIQADEAARDAALPAWAAWREGLACAEAEALDAELDATEVDVFDYGYEMAYEGCDLYKL